MRQLTYGIRRISKWLARLELLFCQILIVAFTCLLIANVASRYVFNNPFYFADELSVYMLIWMAFMAICVTIAYNDMIKLSLGVDSLPRPLRRTIEIVIEILVLGMLATMFYASIRWIQSPAVAFERAITLDMSKLPFLSIIPIFTGLATFHVFSNLLTAIFLPDEEVGVK